MLKELLYQQVPTGPNTILHLKLYEGTAFDYSLSGNSGALAGTAAFTFPGVDLDGDSDYIQVADSTDFNETSTITAACWANSDDANITTNQIMVSKYALTGDKREWNFYLNTDQKVQLELSEDGTNAADKLWSWTTDSAVTVAQWHHYAFTFNAGAFLVYVDGISVDITDANANAGTILNNDDAPVLAGAQFLDSGIPTRALFFDGKIDDVFMFTEVLPAHEIRSIYEVTRRRYGV
ncbi:hypothetical protein LCGC14_1014900 [marine sediment metagenome]|uniref:LamG-like jellyroll fold domain-containing protein n=1 Tax=marine sediment metagenome TaxID=412755 RepID=A0A0F9N3L1_9ZZZZ|nr:LamG domain-containing protein [Pricia sp.]